MLKTYGIVSGLAPKGAVTMKSALLSAAANKGLQVEVVMDDRIPPVDAPDARTALADRKITVMDAVSTLADEGVAAVLVAGLQAQNFLSEVQTETQVPVVSLWKVVADYARKQDVTKIGVLGGCDEAEKKGLVAAFSSLELVFPSDEIGCCCSSEDLATYVVRVAEDLKAQGAELLLPWCEHAVEALSVLEEKGFPVCNPYVLVGDYVVEHEWKRLAKPFKVGMIGGLGPAATVDLYDKITRFTPAKTDQEHIKVVVEQNPQTADRTACLLHGGDDPTLALYDCAKRLEKDGCDALIVPCNTAHAFVPFLERHIKVPFINMQRVTMEEIQRKLGKDARIGLLATSGTIQTGIYAEKAKAMGMPIFTPDEEHQARVMAAIYGPQGAKAGYTDGVCREDLVSAAEYLVKTYDCNCLILGCTELPLILDEDDHFPVAGKTVCVVDPTAVLARKVVAVALETNRQRGIC